MKTIGLLTGMIMFIISGTLILQAQNTEPAQKKTQAQNAAQTKEDERIKNDWANLSRFREENQKESSTQSAKKRVVFMGNSITEGWGNIMPDFFSANSYLNRGISGQTTPQMLIRFRPDVVNLKPAVVVILAGINDIAGNTGPSTQEMIENNISSMVDLAKANGIRVVLSSVLPAFDFPWHKGMKPADKVVKLNQWIKQYAGTHGCIYLDYFTPMADERNGLKSEYTEDGVHPNPKGYEVMVPLVQKAIEQALNL